MKVIIILTVILMVFAIAYAGSLDDAIEDKIYRFIKAEHPEYSESQILELLGLPRIGEIRCAPSGQLLGEGTKVTDDLLRFVVYEFNGLCYETKIIYDHTGKMR